MLGGESLLAACASTFEGPEKKLEIILTDPQPDLRDNSDGRWHRVVAASGAEVISSISSAGLDAYLLSESSLFVWPDRILMITCGKTVLLRAVPEIVKIVGRNKVAMLFYERRKLMFPSDQPADFEADVQMLTPYFPGKSYRLGPANDDHVHLFFSSHKRIETTMDATLQVMMSDLSPVMARHFFAGIGSAAQIEKNSAIGSLYSGMRIDSHLFSPGGFSLNGICDASYYTVHVTPQKEGSYTSFETNVIEPDYSPTVAQVVDAFRPGRFSLVLTSSMEPRLNTLHRVISGRIPGYRILEKSYHEFDCGYAVTFFNCIKDGPQDHAA
jgi:S-adenosylmethionine decarboxylase